MSSVREISLSRLVPSSRNVRRTGADSGLEELVASIAAHGLLQSLVVAPTADDTFEVLAGGRRLAALKALAKAKRVPKNLPVPVIVQAQAGEEVSLAENIVRCALHPADQFEAFSRLAEAGSAAGAIATRFGCSERLVKQRLALGAVSTRLVQDYREGAMTLQQLEAFTVTGDHARQETAWASLSYNKDPYMIRRALMQAAVHGRDRRAIFVGLDSYEAAGGTLARDLFSTSEECWVEDVALLDRLAVAALDTVAEDVRAEGWGWVHVELDLPYAHGFRRLYPEPVDLTPGEEERLRTVTDELEALSTEHPAEAPEDIATHMAALEAEITAIEARASAYPPDLIARGGAFVSLFQDGTARIERGFIRPADEIAERSEPQGGSVDSGEEAHRNGEIDRADGHPEDGEDGPALSDRLAADLSAHRSVAIRDALGDEPDVALIALTHALVAQAFPAGRYDPASCLAIRLDSSILSQYAPGLDDSAAERAVQARHSAWAAQVPRDADLLWEWLVALDRDSRNALLAHVVGLSVVAVSLRATHRTRALDSADRIAEAVDLDMSRYWQASTESFFGRVTKTAILQAVREGVSDEAAARLAGLRKVEMAAEAERLLEKTGWLPAPLRTVQREVDECRELAAAAE